MGWKSTIDLTRKEAEDILRSEIEVSSCTDEQLTDMIEILRGGDGHGHNYRIVPDDMVRKDWRCT